MFTRESFETDLLEIEAKSLRLGDSSFRLVKTSIESQPIVYLVNCHQMIGKDDYQLLTVEFHVVYSESFACPVLYLNVSRCDGSILSYSHLYQLFFGLESSSQPAANLILTQQDHPILNRPFFFLHPCKTNEWMKDTQIDIEPLQPKKK